MPERIMRRRVKGWRQPPDTVYVGRPGMFANPFRITSERPPEQAVEWYRLWLSGDLPLEGWLELSRCSAKIIWPKRTRKQRQAARHDIIKNLPKLRGKNLSCYCSLDQPCHADVLLELANS